MTRQELFDFILQKLPDNTTREISEQDLRDTLSELINSFYNKEDDDLLTSEDLPSGVLPSGGGIGQVIKKVSDSDFDVTFGDVEWGEVKGSITNQSDLIGYIETELNNKLSLSGGTMTGGLTLSGEPVAPLEAATKAYVDANAGGSSVTNNYTNTEVPILNPDGSPQTFSFDGVQKKPMYRQVLTPTIASGSFGVDLSITALTIIRVECWAVNVLNGRVRALSRLGSAGFGEYRYQVVDNVITGFLYNGTMTHSVFLVVEYVKP